MATIVDCVERMLQFRQRCPGAEFDLTPSLFTARIPGRDEPFRAMSLCNLMDRVERWAAEETMAGLLSGGRASRLPGHDDDRLRAVAGDFPFGLPAAQPLRCPAGPAIGHLALSGDGITGAGTAEALWFVVAEVGRGVGNADDQPVAGGRGAGGGGAVPPARAGGGGGLPAAGGVRGAVPAGPPGWLKNRPGRAGLGPA